MQLSLKDDLPFVAAIQITPSENDELSLIRGVGGSEVVFSRVVDCLQIDSHKLTGFEIEVGGMDYGFEIDGILGMDALTQMGVVIDLSKMQIRFAN